MSDSDFADPVSPASSAPSPVEEQAVEEQPVELISPGNQSGESTKTYGASLLAPNTGTQKSAPTQSPASSKPSSSIANLPPQSNKLGSKYLI